MKTIKYHGLDLLPIKSDIVFKAIFGKVESKDITMNIVDYDMFMDDRFLHMFRYKDSETYDDLSDLCEINFLELGKVPNRWYNEKQMWSLFISTENEKVVVINV